MPVAEIDDFDHRAVVRAERIAGVQLGNAAAENSLPVGTHIQDFAGELGSADPPAHNRDNSAFACAAVAHFANRVQINIKISDMPQGWFG